MLPLYLDFDGDELVKIQIRLGILIAARWVSQHTEEVLLELGLDWEEISALRRARAI